MRYTDIDKQAEIWLKIVDDEKSEQFVLLKWRFCKKLHRWALPQYKFGCRISNGEERLYHAN
jgi:hypothetical protein